VFPFLPRNCKEKKKKNSKFNCRVFLIPLGKGKSVRKITCI
jgi:hypothetical protein